MTQKDKLREATKMAIGVRSIANSIRCDANEYDTRWPLTYADSLDRLADSFLKS